MAAIATIAKISAVNIIPVMATAAGTGQHHLFIHHLPVAGHALARNFFVRTAQLEAGLVVIEIPSLPVARVVASMAVLAKPALMHIIFLVA